MSEKRKLTLKDWADEDKPREKLLQHGRKELTNTELLAILLRSGVPGQSVVELAKQILDDCGNDLHQLSKISVEELNHYKGMGDAKSITLVAALELGRRLLDQRNNEVVDRISSSEEFFQYMAPKLADLQQEEFWVLFLDARSKVIDRKCIAKGGITQTVVDIRVIFKLALEKGAVKIMVAHNHPSGDLNPSQLDKDLTQQIAEAGHLLHITLIDHIIIGIRKDYSTDYFSFSESGLM